MRKLSPVLVLLIAVAVFAQGPVVNHVAIVAKPKVYTGPCPASMQFVGTIFVNRQPAKVTYRWERSDRATGPVQTIVIRAAGQGVYTTWQLGKAPQTYHIWERVHVLAPENVYSPPGNATVNCL